MTLLKVSSLTNFDLIYVSSFPKISRYFLFIHKKKKVVFFLKKLISFNDYLI